MFGVGERTAPSLGSHVLGATLAAAAWLPAVTNSQAAPSTQNCNGWNDTAGVEQLCTGNGFDYGGRCAYLVQNTWTNTDEWNCADWCRKQGSSCYKTIKDRNCENIGEASCEDNFIDAICICDDSLPETREEACASSSLTDAISVVSDGSKSLPHCSWSNTCTWDDATRAICAQKLCEAAGYVAGVFVDASNNMCTESFLGLYKSSFFWLVDQGDLFYGNAHDEAQITACCSNQFPSTETLTSTLEHTSSSTASTATTTDTQLAESMTSTTTQGGKPGRLTESSTMPAIVATSTTSAASVTTTTALTAALTTSATLATGSETTASSTFTTTRTLKCNVAPLVFHAVNAVSCTAIPEGHTCNVTCEDGYVMAGEVRCQDGKWMVTGSCVLVGTETTMEPVVQVIIYMDSSQGIDWAMENQARIEAAVESTIGLTNLVVDIVPADGGSGARRLQSHGTAEVQVTAALESAPDDDDQVVLDVSRSLARGFISNLTFQLESEGKSVPQGLEATFGQPEVIPSFQLPVKSWIVFDWGICSTECGLGDETRTVACSVGVEETCTRAGVGPRPADSQRCEQFTSCPFEALCPLGRGKSLSCSAQMATALAAAAVIVACVLACVCRQLYLKRNPKQGQSVTITDGIKASYVVERRCSQASQADLEQGSGGPTDSKKRIIWNVNLEEVQQIFQRQGSAIKNDNGSPVSEDSGEVVGPMKSSGSSRGHQGSRRFSSGLLRRLSRTISRSTAYDSAEEASDMDFDLDDRIEAALMQARQSAATQSRSAAASALGRRMSVRQAQAAVEEMEGEAGHPQDTFTAYCNKQKVEYFSRTYMRWVPGVVSVSTKAGKGGIGSWASVRYDVELSKGQKRQHVTLDQLRLPLSDGERVQVFAKRQCKFVGATMSGSQASTATLGYKILLDGAEEPIGGVPPSHLRRLFVGGDSVQIYRGPTIGWTAAEVIAEPDPHETALLMPQFSQACAWLEGGTELSHSIRGRLGSMGSMGTIGTLAAADAINAAPTRKSDDRLPSRTGNELLGGSSSRRSFFSGEGAQASLPRRSFLSFGSAHESPKARSSLDVVATGTGSDKSGSNASDPLPRLLSRGKLPPLKPKQALAQEDSKRIEDHADSTTPSENPNVSSSSNAGLHQSAPTLLRITVVGATGLRDTDWMPGQDKSDPYCICEVSDKPKTRFQTPVMNDTLDPVWNHVAELSEISAEDDLVFTVMDKDSGKSDELLGKAVLTGAQFHARGFAGEVPLIDAGKDGATLRVRIQCTGVSSLEPWVWVPVLAVAAKNVCNPPESQPEWAPSFLVRSRCWQVEPNFERNDTLTSI